MVDAPGVGIKGALGEELGAGKGCFYAKGKVRLEPLLSVLSYACFCRCTALCFALVTRQRGGTVWCIVGQRLYLCVAALRDSWLQENAKSAYIPVAAVHDCRRRVDYCNRYLFLQYL